MTVRAGLVPIRGWTTSVLDFPAGFGFADGRALQRPLPVPYRCRANLPKDDRPTA